MVIGSDHCPISVQLNIELNHVSPQYSVPPPLCAVHVAHFFGKQISLKESLGSCVLKPLVAAASMESNASRKQPASSQAPSVKRNKSKQIEILSFLGVKNSQNDSEENTASNVSNFSEFDRILLKKEFAPTILSSNFLSLFTGAQPAPRCIGHGEACVEKSVTKAGKNHGRRFYSCARHAGLSSNKNANCNFFKWI